MVSRKNKKKIAQLSPLVQLKKWHRWRFKNTSLLVMSLIAFVFLVQTPLVESIIQEVGQLGYLGAFITGIFFVSTFTVAPAIAVLFHIAEVLNPWEVALLAGLGAMLGDYILFRFMKDKVFEELRPVFMKLPKSKLNILFRSPYFAWMLPLFGAFIIASPLPDEVGVSVMGLSKIKRWQFFVLAFVLNSVGILLTILAAQAVKS